MELCRLNGCHGTSLGVSCGGCFVVAVIASTTTSTSASRWANEMMLWFVQIRHCVTLSPNATDLLCVRTEKTRDRVTTLVIMVQFNCFLTVVIRGR